VSELIKCNMNPWKNHRPCDYFSHSLQF